MSSIASTRNVPEQLRASIRAVLLNVDLAARVEKDARSGFLVSMFAAQHAAGLGPDVCDKVRKDLLAIADRFAKQDPQPPHDPDETQGALLSAAFYLYRRGPCPEPYRQIAALLEDLVGRWPGLALECQTMVDLLVAELPNRQSRHFWSLQVKLRGIV